MSNNVQQISKSDLEKGVINSRTYLNNGISDIPSRIRHLDYNVHFKDKMSSSTYMGGFPSDECAFAFSGMSKTLGGYVALKDKLMDDERFANGSMDTETHILLNIFCLKHASNYGLDSVGGSKEDGGRKSWKPIGLPGARDSKNNERVFIEDVMNHYVSYIREENEFTGPTQEYLTKLIPYLEKEFDSFSDHNDYPYLKDLAIQFEGSEVVSNGTTSSMTAQKDKFSYAVDFKGVFGNEETKGKMQEYVNIMGFYDADKGYNHALSSQGISKPISLLLDGLPGGGKTLSTKALHTELQKLCDIKGIDLNYKIVDNTFKNKYFGQSIQNLEKELSTVTDPKGLGLLVLDDADAILNSRGSNNENATEDQIIQHFLGWLEGLKNQYQGNYMVVLTTNFADKLDIAVKSRMMETLQVEGPSECDEHINVIKTNARSILDYVKVDDQGWKDIGELCTAYNFSGRDDSTIAQQMLNSVIDLSEIKNNPDNQKKYFGDNSKLEDNLESLKRPIGTTSIIDLVEKKNNANIYEQVQKEKREIIKGGQDKTKQIMINIEATAEVLGNLLAKKGVDESKIEECKSIVREKELDKLLDSYKTDYDIDLDEILKQ